MHIIMYQTVPVLFSCVLLTALTVREYSCVLLTALSVPEYSYVLLTALTVPEYSCVLYLLSVEKLKVLACVLSDCPPINAVKVLQLKTN